MVQVSNCDVNSNQYETKGRSFGVTTLVSFPPACGSGDTGGDGLGSASGRALGLAKLFS